MKHIVYTGYKIVDCDIKTKLEPYINEKISDLRENIFTVKYYHTDKPAYEMISWYNKNCNKIIIGYLKKIYIHETKNVLTIIGEIAIEGSYYYITFVNESNISLQNIKLLTNKGSFGSAIELQNTIPIEMIKIIHPEL